MFGITPVVVATYNIHRCIGRDGRCDPARIVEVIREVNPDVIGLQEVESRHGGVRHAKQLAYLAAETGLASVSGPTMLRADAEYGNALLTRHRILQVRRLNLSIAGREPRGALDVDVSVQGVLIRVITTHLGLRAHERRWQVSQLLQTLAGRAQSPTLLLVDINEWIPGSRLMRRLDRQLGKVRSPRSFPSSFPILPLDRIWAWPNTQLQLLSLRAHTTLTSRAASDHLPVCGQLAVAQQYAIPRPV